VPVQVAIVFECDQCMKQEVVARPLGDDSPEPPDGWSVWMTIVERVCFCTEECRLAFAFRNRITHW
jgi:hypothetical protein